MALQKFDIDEHGGVTSVRSVVTQEEFSFHKF